jgi:putative transposase
MQDQPPGVGLSRFCRLLGISRQAYYQHFWQERTRHLEQELVLKEVKRIRTNHPYLGTRKLYHLLQPFLTEHQVKMGRDALFDL